MNQDLSLSKKIEEGLFYRRPKMDHIIIEDNTVYEIDEGCVKQMKGQRCAHSKNIVWEMEYMMELLGCDLILVDA